MSDDPRQKLSSTKLALLHALRRGQGAAPQTAAPAPVAVERPRPSFTQERLLFFEQVHPGTSVQNLWGFWHLRGRLDVAALERAVEALARRHEALRMRFPLEAGEPTLVVDAEPRLAVRTVELAAGVSREDVLQLARACAETPFPLAEGPLARLVLWRVSAREHWLLLGAHHTVIDGWSLGLFLRELGVRKGPAAPGSR